MIISFLNSLPGYFFPLYLSFFSHKILYNDLYVPCSSLRWSISRFWDSEFLICSVMMEVQFVSYGYLNVEYVTSSLRVNGCKRNERGNNGDYWVVLFGYRFGSYRLEFFLLLETRFVPKFGDDLCMCVCVHMLREGDRGMLCKLSQFPHWSQKNKVLWYKKVSRCLCENCSVYFLFDFGNLLFMVSIFFYRQKLW